MNTQWSEFTERVQKPGVERNFVIAMALLFILAFCAAWVVEPLYVVVLVIATPLLVWWGARPFVPLLLIAVTFPFTSVELTAGALNVPIADAVAFIAIIAWVFRMLYMRVVHNKRMNAYEFPAWPAALAFFAIAAISAAGTIDPELPFKYVARPLLFFYLAFIFLPVNAIRTRESLERILVAISGLGVVVALYGLVGFIVAPATSFLSRRVVPVDILGINPLASNHNLIANVLIIAIPVTLYLLLKNSTRDQLLQKLLFIGLLIMVVATALTFSRTGWLALFLELLVLFFFQYRHHLRNVARYTGAALVIALPLIAYMTFFSAQDVVQSSNYNRVLLNEIAVAMVQEAPLFGTGPGTFISYVSRNTLYITEFGAPLDSHGFVQKVIGETGILGLLAYSALLLGTLWPILRRVRAYTANAGEYSQDQYLAVSLMAMAAGAAFFQLFQTSYFIGLMWLPIGIALAGSRIALEENKAH